jgi:NAD(P)-dependent dehydrogenase (short-subunit alcohol dehydrogenase family)
MTAPAEDLTGKTIVITGASSGLGRAAAVELAARGAEVAVVGRNPERTKAVAEAIGGTAFLADFDHLDQVRGLADDLLARYDRIDVLANNAGGLVSRHAITADGFERTFQSNHLAPFLLTNLLLPQLAANGGRVISTASGANLMGRLDLDDLNWEKRSWFGGWKAYGTSKLQTILFIEELARRTGIAAYSFHPGFVSTRFGEDSAPLKIANFVSAGRLGLRPEQGAEPLVYLASADTVAAPNGSYFDRMKADGAVNRQASEAGLASAFWERSIELVGLAGKLAAGNL